MGNENPNKKFLDNLTREEENDLREAMERPGSEECGASGNEVAREEHKHNMNPPLNLDELVRRTGDGTAYTPPIQ